MGSWTDRGSSERTGQTAKTSLSCLDTHAGFTGTPPCQAAVGGGKETRKHCPIPGFHHDGADATQNINSERIRSVCGSSPLVSLSGSQRVLLLCCYLPGIACGFKMAKRLMIAIMLILIVIIILTTVIMMIV